MQSFNLSLVVITSRDFYRNLFSICSTNVYISEADYGWHLQVGFQLACRRELAKWKKYIWNGTEDGTDRSRDGWDTTIMRPLQHRLRRQKMKRRWNLFTDLLECLHPARGEVTVLKNDPRTILDCVVDHLGCNRTLTTFTTTAIYIKQSTSTTLQPMTAL